MDSSDPRPPDRGTQAWLGRGLAWGGMLLVLLVFFGPALGSSTFIYRDTGRLHAPVKRWIGEELARGRFPQWNPYSGLGTPVVPNAVDAVQHPFTALLVLWPDLGLKLWVLLSFVAAGWGAITWARSVGLGWRASFVAGVAFALSGPLVSASDNVQFLTSYAALPWVLAALQVWIRGGRPSGLVGVAVASALCLAGGDPQSWGLLLAGFVPYALAFAPEARREAVRRAAIALPVALVLAAPVLLPMAVWLPNTERVGGLDPLDPLRWNLHPARLVELVIPNLFRGADISDPLSPVFQVFCGNEVTPIPWFLTVYLGATVLALAVAGAVADLRVRWLALGVGVLAWAALGPYAGFGWVAAHVPLLGAFRYWEKLSVWLGLLGALAAAAGMQAALDGRRRLVATPALVGAALLLSVAGVSTAWPSVLPGQAGPEVRALLAANLRNGALQGGSLLALLGLAVLGSTLAALRRLWPVLVVAIVAADLMGANGGGYVVGPGTSSDAPPLARALGPGTRVLAPFKEREDRWPELGRFRSTWEWLRRTLGPSWNVPLRVATSYDYVSLREGRWSRLQAVLREGPAVANLGLLGFEYLIVPGSLRFAPRAGVTGPFDVVAQDPELPAWVVRVPHRPRAYLAEKVRQVEAEEAFRFAASGGVPGEVVVEAPIAVGWQPGPGAARIVEDVPGQTGIDVDAESSSLLVLNDAWAPGWSATVDGQAAEILRANWVVRAVRVPAGVHQVRFRYRTPGLCLGWAIALAGTVLLAGWSVAARRGGPAKPARPGASAGRRNTLPT